MEMFGILIDIHEDSHDGSQSDWFGDLYVKGKKYVV